MARLSSVSISQLAPVVALAWRVTNSSTPSTLLRRGSHFGIDAAQVLNVVCGSLWQVLHEKPIELFCFHSSCALSTAHMPGFSIGSRLSRFSTGGGRLVGSSSVVLNAAGDFSVFRNATMSLISWSLKKPWLPQGGITVSGLKTRAS